MKTRRKMNNRKNDLHISELRVRRFCCRWVHGVNLTLRGMDWMENKNSHLLCQTTLPVGVPGNGTVRRVGAQADPLVAGSAEDAIGFELSDIGICAKIVDALFLRTLRTASFGRWVRKGLGSAFRRVNDCFWTGLGGAAEEQ